MKAIVGLHEESQDRYRVAAVLRYLLGHRKRQIVRNGVENVSSRW
jgi:hypothetical protein